MKSSLLSSGRLRAVSLASVAAVSASAAMAGIAHAAPVHQSSPQGWPGDLVVSTARYRAVDIQPGVTVLPPGCTMGCATATADGAYPYVFNNDLIDPSFGVAAPIVLHEITPNGRDLATEKVPQSQLVTSFSSKSELALNLSTSGRQVTFMGYVAPPRSIDVSNSNTPLAPDPTNPVTSSYYRGVASLTPRGGLSVTETNAYSGNNGRAAIANDSGPASLLYTAGNAGNGANPQPAGVVLGAGAQILDQSFLPESEQTRGLPTPVGSFNVTQLGDPADKIGKDDNFRGLTIENHVLYYTKGSGSNGVNTVYFLDTTGHACPNGVGVPAAGARLPTQPLPADPSTVASTGLPSNMCIYPFGIWFANPDTLYVADEGDGDATYSAATGQYTSDPASAQAGLQKWTFNSSTQSWTLAYTLQQGLNLGRPYTVAGYPTGDNPATNLPWAPATDGLRNITGVVGRNGDVTIYAVTSTVSGSGDPGADPNQLVSISDDPTSSSPASGEAFTTVVPARYGQVVRGVSPTPGTPHRRP